MKTKLLSLIILIFSYYHAYSQQTAADVLKKQVVIMLQNDGLLLADDQKKLTGDQRSQKLWKNDHQKEKFLINDTKLKARLLTQFQSPSFLDSLKVVSKSLTFLDKSIGLIGSYVIRNNDLSIIDKSRPLPGFPVLVNGTQLAVFSPLDDGSNFVLNYTSAKSFQGGVDAHVDAGFKDYFQTKLQANTDITNEKDWQISIAAGVFQNQLGEVLNRINTGHGTASDFTPAYYILDSYRNGEIQAGDKVLYSFDGLCFFSTKGVKNKETQKYSANVNSSLDFPFIKASLSANATWTTASNFSSQSNIYNIYMFSSPQLVSIPSVSQIIRSWSNLTPKGTAISFPTSGTASIPVDGPLIGKVVFGPIPDNSMLPLLKVDENYSKAFMKNNPFITRIKLITDDPQRIVAANNGYYTFDLEFYRDNSYIQNTYTTVGPTISANIPIKIFVDNPIGTDTLKKIYDNITITTDRYPIPQVDNYEIASSKSENGYDYKFSIFFSTPTNKPINIVSSPQPIKITQVFGLPTSINDSFSSDIKSSSFKLKDNNKYDFVFTIPQTAKYFDINHRSYDVEVLFEFNGDNGISYKRKLPVRIIGPKDLIAQLNTAAAIAIRDNAQLISSLNTSAILENNKTIQDLITSNTKSVDGNNNLDVLSLINDLKKANKVTDNPDNNSPNKYFVVSTILDISKLNK